MAIKIINNLSLATFSNYNGLRNDFKYFQWYNNYINEYKNTKKLKYFIDAYFKGYAFEGDDFQTEGEVVALKGICFDNDFFVNYENAEFLPTEFYDDLKFKKFILQKNDIVIYLVGATIGKMVLIRDDRSMLLNQNAIAIRLNKSYNSLVYTYIISQIVMKMVNEVYKISGYSFLRIEDLFSLQVPELSEDEQDYILKEINKFEAIIHEEKSSLVSTDKIINETFNNYFTFNIIEFNKLKEDKVYNTHFLLFGNNVDSRFSVKFHRPAGEFVYQELKKRPHKKLKEFIEIPIITGQGITPSDFDDDGDYCYISMAEINTWELNTDELKNVSNQYASENKTKKVKGVPVPISTELEINDIVMMRSGEGGIGKVAIIKEEITAIFCDFLIRIRVNERLINPEFAYYFFRTYYFQYLVEINKKGLGNNTNIFPNIIQEFPIPDIQIDEQKRIVDKINEEIEKQKMIEEKILKERNKIEQILSDVLKKTN